MKNGSAKQLMVLVLLMLSTISRGEVLLNLSSEEYNSIVSSNTYEMDKVVEKGYYRLLSLNHTGQFLWDSYSKCSAQPCPDIVFDSQQLFHNLVFDNYCVYWNTDILTCSILNPAMSDLKSGKHIQIPHEYVDEVGHKYTVRYFMMLSDVLSAVNTTGTFEIPNSIESFWWGKGYLNYSTMNRAESLTADTLIVGSSLRSVPVFEGCNVLYLKAGIPYSSIYGYNSLFSPIDTVYDSSIINNGDRKEYHSIRCKEVHVPSGFSNYYSALETVPGLKLIDDLPVVPCSEIKFMHKNNMSGYLGVNGNIDYYLDITDDTVNIKVGQDLKLAFSCEPYDATVRYFVDLVSSNVDIVCIDDDYTVRGVKEGKAIITATALDGSGVTSDLVVNVRKYESADTILFCSFDQNDVFKPHSVMLAERSDGISDKFVITRNSYYDYPLFDPDHNTGCVFWKTAGYNGDSDCLPGESSFLIGPFSVKKGTDYVLSFKIRSLWSTGGKVSVEMIKKTDTDSELPVNFLKDSDGVLQIETTEAKGELFCFLFNVETDMDNCYLRFSFLSPKQEYYLDDVTISRNIVGLSKVVDYNLIHINYPVNMISCIGDNVISIPLNSISVSAMDPNDRTNRIQLNVKRADIKDDGIYVLLDDERMFNKTKLRDLCVSFNNSDDGMLALKYKATGSDDWKYYPSFTNLHVINTSEFTSQKTLLESTPDMISLNNPINTRSITAKFNEYVHVWNAVMYADSGDVEEWTIENTSYIDGNIKFERPQCYSRNLNGWCRLRIYYSDDGRYCEIALHFGSSNKIEKIEDNNDPIRSSNMVHYHDILGRQIESTNHGIYIIDGKKVLKYDLDSK